MKPVANQVKAKDSDHDGDPGISGQMGRDQQKLPSIVQHRSPGRRRRFDAQSQKTQAAFGDNRRRQSKSSLDKQRSKKIGKQMARNEASRFTAERPSGLDKLLLP